ncbi:MAG TPA: endo alpha-1,4 polygalactosaminidase [Polyangiaceae bacterium]|nr:endo alpha-1,4 polygalactosaminidase [Polyangiaceae bacterium]
MRRKAPVLLLLGAFGFGCAGTEGTLLVLHDRSSAGNSAAGSSAAGNGGGPAAEMPYVPPPGASWAARLDGAVDVGLEVDFFYLDVEQQGEEDLARLRASGRHYLCYLSAGSVESFRDDAEEFPPQAIGNQLVNFENERWLDVRDAQVRELMARRVTALAASGCAGVPPSAMAVHAADTGFELTLDDALDYARWLAERIHAAGMSAGLQGPAALADQLWPTFDFALAVDCLANSGCAEFASFVQAGKTVLHVEYGDESSAAQICMSAKTLGFDPLITDPGFSGSRIACRDIL